MKPTTPTDSRADLSAPTSPSNASVGGADVKRRKTTAAGGGGGGGGVGSGGGSSRGVANLSAEQLAKKRANDREAQRAIRERTKTQIESLERQIVEIKAQKPYQELQEALRQKDLIQAKNDEMRQQLTSALSILQPILNERRANGQAPLVGSASLPLSLQTAPPYQPSSSNIVHTPPANLSTPTSTVADTASNGSFPSPSVPGPDHAARAGWTVAGDSHPPSVPRHSPVIPLDPRRGSLPLAQERQRLGLDFLLDGSQNTPKVATPIAPTAPHQAADHSAVQSPTSTAGPSGPPVDTFGGSEPAQQWAPHSTPVRNVGPTCPLDSLLLEFLTDRRQLAASGVTEQELVGPLYPSITSLVYPERSVWSHPLSKMFTDILSKFPDLSSLPEQIAVLYVMFLIMRWQISPTQDNYDRLPDWVTPRPSQLFTSHPAWIDHLPWPRMRDVLVRTYSACHFDNFFIPFTSTLSLNWPYEPTDTMISSSESDEVSLNPVFERHLRNLNNWSLGPAFVKAHPTLVESVRIQPNVNRPVRTADPFAS